MDVAFSIDKKGLRVSLTIIEVPESPEGYTFNWAFGDASTLVTNNPETVHHNYNEVGLYTIKLSVKDESGSIIAESEQSLLIVSLTGLTGSIYDLIDNYIPELLKLDFQSVKVSYIEKWQFYFQPLVNHDIPLNKFNDESYYEALENQLVMEMAAYDYLIVELGKAITNLSVAGSNSLEINEDGSVSGSTDDNVKKIKTGPSEVEFHDKYDSASKIVKSLSGTRGGSNGILSTLRNNITMIAHRLDIYLPIGGASDKIPIIPKVLKSR